MKKWGILIKKESEGLDFTGLEIIVKKGRNNMDKYRNIIAIKEKNCRVVKWSGILIAVASGVSMFALSFNGKKVPDIVMYMMIIGIVMSFVATYIGNIEKKHQGLKH